MLSSFEAAPLSECHELFPEKENQIAAANNATDTAKPKEKGIFTFANHAKAAKSSRECAAIEKNSYRRYHAKGSENAQADDARNARPHFCRTLKMSHDRGWREACASTIRDSCGRWL
jgi:hypothetical protein